MSPGVQSKRRVSSPASGERARGRRGWFAPESDRPLAGSGSSSEEGRGEVRSRRSQYTVAALNVCVALLLLVLAAPLMAFVAILMRLTSRGPVLYSQVRVGIDRRGGSPGHGHSRQVNLGGRPFLIHKFRTMHVDPGQTAQVWTKPGDGRITGIGRVLRAYRIDELPQLVNVLKREMNVVGPRPEQPEIFAQFRERYESFPERQRVLPGITGLAQVKCGYGGDDFQMKRKLECDLEYVERRDLALDLEILVRTVPVVLLKLGAR